MREEQTVTIAGVPVTVTVADRVLTVTTGQFDPAAAGRLLAAPPSQRRHLDRRVYIADENDDTAREPDHRRFFDLHPGPPDLPGQALSITEAQGH